MRVETFRPHGGWAGLGPGTFRSELRPSTTGTASEPTPFLTFQEKVTPATTQEEEAEKSTEQRGTRCKANSRQSFQAFEAGGAAGAYHMRAPSVRASKSRHAASHWLRRSKHMAVRWDV